MNQKSSGTQTPKFVRWALTSDNAGSAMITFGDDPLSIGVICANKMSSGAENNLTTMLTAVGRPDLLKPDPR